jgi:hypothetical protein
VVENNKVVGVISIGDVVKSMLEDKETLIKGLENYILQGGSSCSQCEFKLSRDPDAGTVSGSIFYNFADR